MCNNLIGKYGWKTPFGRLKDRLKDKGVRMYLEDRECGLLERISMAQTKD
jgi:hypothetical protein